MKRQKKIIGYYSQTWGVKVRPDIGREFTYNNKFFDENLAGLHEIRAQMAEKRYCQKQPA